MLPVSVLVPTIGRPDRLAECLASLSDCEPRAAEIVVVDQSETDEVAAICERFGARRVPCHPAGLGRAMNAGLRAAEHELVLGTHDDCTVATDWVTTGHRLLVEHPGAIVTGRVLPEPGAGHVPSCRTDPEPRDYTGMVRIDKLYPACMGVPRSAVVDLGGFDERFQAAAEDNDLCFRWLRAGRTLRYEPALTVWHHDWRSEADLERMYRGYAYASGQFYGKHLRRGEWRIVPWVLRDLALALLPRRKPVDWRRAILPAMPRGIRDGWRY